MFNNTKTYIISIIFLLGFFSCNDKPNYEDTYIELDGTKLKLLDKDFTGTPTTLDTSLYSLVIEDSQSTIRTKDDKYEDVFATWEINGENIGYGIEVQHVWKGGGVQEINAIFLDNSRITAFVNVLSNKDLIVPESDTDNDGIPDNKDACPNIIGTLQNNGCPAEVDSDNDGIPDSKDACPKNKGLKQYKGCPNPPISNSDLDQDGIPDKDDECPNLKGSKQSKGCPDPIDRDKDGIQDNFDKCPDEKGLIEHNGCPDSDGDGVMDSEDKCPDQKGTKELNGCPPTVVAFTPTSSGMIYKVTSSASLDNEKGLIDSGKIKITPSQTLVLFEAKLIASNHGRIEFTIDGSDLKNGISIVKNLNSGVNTIRFNDLKNVPLRAGNTYYLSFKVLDNLEVVEIKNAFVSGLSNDQLKTSGKIIFFDLVYKY